MNAIEFQAVAHDGVLDIPPEHRRVLDGKKVRVVLVDAEPQNSDANRHLSVMRSALSTRSAALCLAHDG